jgi:hypothetical protein
MALGAGGWQTREFNGTCVPRVALRTRANRSVFIRFSDRVALLASRGGRRMPFGKHQRIGRTFRSAWLELLAERDLLRRQSLFTVNRRPTWRCVAAAEKFLVNAFVAGAAVSGSQMGADYEPVVIDFLLAGSRLMAIKTVDALLRVCGHLVFVDDRVLKAGVALRALTRGPNKIGGWLCGFDAWSRPIHKKSTQNERKRDHNSQEHGTKRHAVGPPGNMDDSATGIGDFNRGLNPNLSFGDSSGSLTLSPTAAKPVDQVI